jgi:DNA-binding response OmpR family regulator
MGHKVKMLIVDDDTVTRAILNDVLSKHGFDVSEVDSGEAAVKTAGESPIDIVLLDTVLKGMGGHETCRKLKQTAPGIKVIIMTGKIGAVDVREAREAGADGYCVKTADCEDLLETIQDVG